MLKKTTTLSIDNEIIDSMKEKKFNMSETAEKAMREKLGEVIIRPETEKCKCCGAEGKIATADDTQIGLMFIWPEEYWICQKCFKIKAKPVY